MQEVLVLRGAYVWVLFRWTISNIDEVARPAVGQGFQRSFHQTVLQKTLIDESSHHVQRRLNL